MPFSRTTLTATVGDNFSRFIDLLTPTSSAIEGMVVNGVFSFEANGVQVAILAKGVSPTQVNTTGQAWPVNSFRGEGPNVDPGSGVYLQEIWVKNTTPGSNGRVVFTGTVLTEA